MKLVPICIITIIIILAFTQCDDSDKYNIEYPYSGVYGVNILAIDLDSINFGDYSLCAVLSIKSSLSVKISGWSWGVEETTMTNKWEYTPYDWKDDSRVFTNYSSGRLDGRIIMDSGSEILFEIFENGDTIPTWIKSFHIK